MNDKITKELTTLQGKIGVYYKNLITGEIIQYNETTPFRAASVIKLPLLAIVLQKIKEGQLRKDDTLRLKTEDKVPSCGALNYMHSGLEVTIWDLCHLMIVISDNTATNMLIDLLGFEEIKERFASIGLSDTVINRLLFDEEQIKKGVDNYFTPLEIGQLLEKIYFHELISPDVCDDILMIMKQQQMNHKIPYLLPKSIEIAHKTGESTGITHDVGIIYGEKPFILCFASNDTNVVKTETVMRDMAKQLYDYTNDANK